MDTPDNHERDELDALIDEGEGPLDRLRATHDCGDLVTIGDVLLRLRRYADRRRRGGGTTPATA